MRLSDEQYFANQKEALARLLDGHARSKNLLDLVKAAAVLHWLRRIHREKPELTAPHVDELKQLADDLRGRLARSADALATLYEAIAVRRRALEKAALQCRKALVEICLQVGDPKLLLGGGAVRAVRLLQLKLPDPASSERARLVGFLKEHGYWDRVSTLSGPRLKAALTSGAVEAEHQKLLTDLYRFEDTYQLTPRSPDVREHETTVWSLVDSAGGFTPLELEDEVTQRVAEAEAAADEWEELAKDAYLEGYDDALNDKDAEWMESEDDE